MGDIEKENADPGFVERMNVLIGRVGGPGELARTAHLSRRVIDKYRRGESDPSRARLIAMAVAANVSVEWLATGIESRHEAATPPFSPARATAEVDQDILAGLLEVVLPPHHAGSDRSRQQEQACLIATFYAELVATYPDRDERMIGLKLQLERLRRILDDRLQG